MSYNRLAVREIERTIFTTPSTNGLFPDSAQKINDKQREQPTGGTQKGGDLLTGDLLSSLEFWDSVAKAGFKAIAIIVGGLLLFIGVLLW